MLNRNNMYELENIRQSERKSRHSLKKLMLAAAGSAVIAGSIWGGTMIGRNTSVTAQASTVNILKNDQNASSFNSTGLPDVSDLVAACMPQVVSITNIIEVNSTTGGSGFGFGFFGQNSSQPQSQTSQGEAYGSGVIIGKTDSELLMVTNNHVAVYDESGQSFYQSYTASTKELKVTFVDGTEVQANLKGADSEADIAVIAVKLSDLSQDTLDAIDIATVGDSDALKVGQGVLAIGNALGRGQTATVGYVTALNREVTTSEDNVTRTLLQTDAAINAGNSGGGLFDANGNLVGINSVKNSGSGVEGMGYAIPISSVEELINNMMNEKTKIKLDESERGYLGIRGADVPASYVQAYGIPEGAMVTEITAGSPAEQGGIHVSDIVTGVEGQKVTSYEELRSALSYYAKGENVEITVQRANGSKYEEMKLSVTLCAREDIEPSTAADEAQPETDMSEEQRIQLQKSEATTASAE